MNRQTGNSRLHALRKKWSTVLRLTHIFLICAVSIFISYPAIRFFYVSAFLIPFFVSFVAVLDYLIFFKELKEEDIVIFLDKHLPGVEESAGLLLMPHQGYNLFEKLQVSKVERALDQPIEFPRSLARRFRFSMILLALSIVVCTIICLVPIRQVARQTTTHGMRDRAAVGKPETKPPQIETVLVTITPPGYTGQRSRKQEKFNIVAEEGAAINWSITTSSTVQSVQMLFNDKTVSVLQALNNDATIWSISKQVERAGFYQLKIEGTVSEFYKIEVIKDSLPSIVVRDPQSSTLIEAGRQPAIMINGMVSDDYGLSNLFLSATIARGSGEAVTFKDQRLAFPGFVKGINRHPLKRQINLSELGMTPGDELYFYISATDNRNQEKRTDIFVVRLEDTSALMSIEGMASGVDIQPEFFRSQRQIIIETEQLLTTRASISTEVFNNKCNELGVDQKLLRLRYGKFLGEETDAEIGASHDHDEEGHGNGTANDVAEMMEGYMHKHDNAEDATFFDAETKKQLKATLAEMWKAELQLRTLKPKDALPFEYKALKLLKELQQQTRVYVAKTGSKTTPLKPEKRLTGELDKIIQPLSQQTIKNNTEQVNILRKALGILEAVRNKEPLEKAAAEVLQETGMQLSTRAALEPSRYLPSLEALRRILHMKFQSKDINMAGTGIQAMISALVEIPYPSTTRPDMKLSQRYFLNLNRRNE